MIKYLIGFAIAFTIFSILYSSFISNKQKVAGEKLATLIMDKKFNDFDKEIKEMEKKKTLPPFNIIFLKLNRAIVEDKGSLVIETLNQANNTKLVDSQKDIIYKKAFHYYLSKKDKTNCTKYHQLLSQLNRRDFPVIDRLYDTYINNGYKYLDSTLQSVDLISNDDEKMQVYLLLSNMYANKKDDENVKKYLELAQDIMNK